MAALSISRTRAVEEGQDTWCIVLPNLIPRKVSSWPWVLYKAPARSGKLTHSPAHCLIQPSGHLIKKPNLSTWEAASSALWPSLLTVHSNRAYRSWIFHLWSKTSDPVWWENSVHRLAWFRSPKIKLNRPKDPFCYHYRAGKLFIALPNAEYSIQSWPSSLTRETRQPWSPAYTRLSAGNKAYSPTQMFSVNTTHAHIRA